MPFSTSKSALGIALEAVRGTAAAAPANFIPVKGMTPAEMVPPLKDESWRGSMAKTYGAAPGPQHATYGAAGNIFADTFGYLLVGMLGNDAVTGAAAPYAHAVTLENGGTGQPPSYTYFDLNGLEANAYAGGIVTDLTIKLASQALAEYTATLVMQSFASGVAPVTSYGGLPPMPAYKTVVTLGGAASPRNTDVEINIKRTGDPIITLNNTTGAYTIFAAGDLVVTGKIMQVYEVSTLRDIYRTGATTSVDLALAIGAGATTQNLGLHCSNAYLTKADVARGKSYVELDCDFEGIATPADAGPSGGAGPIKATLSNAVAAGIYHA